MANANMTFNIDTKVNKSGINDLKKELQILKTMTSQDLIDIGSAKSLTEAKQKLQEIKTSAGQLESVFNKAFNSDLGTVNLTKFNQGLNTLNITKIASDFKQAGAAGQSVFRSLTTEVLTTNLYLKESNGILAEMGKTMTNTIRWGIASSAMNTFTGSVQKAYGYVKNLDKSLNDIRIVSGQTADQMERFARQANRAAKELGATTLDYTNASLIYYQQGLNDTEVEARTNATIKMANVTGEAAQDVSDYMTAIWNNFADGSETLEYYADVITALGAATASSTDEIAAGLEKFAAVADTVGLSYEYATAALATVTAETRQSADVVGNAFKTLFARIQDLELGKTLDDGTTLGSYSQALEKVGISIKDANGEIKDMDIILNEMGSKWSVLSKDAQIALAQNVAGVRQYTQLVALMDNWDVFKDNLQITAEATGTLNKQNEIYLQSTEAHLNKLSTAAERIYDNIIDSKGLNNLIDIFTGLVTGAGNFVEAIGGSQGVLLGLGSLVSKVFGKQIAQSLAVTITNMKTATKNAAQLKAEIQVLEQFKGIKINDEAYNHLIQMKQGMIALQDTLTNEQRAEANALIQRYNDIMNQKDAFDQATQSAKNYYQTLIEEDPNLGNLQFTGEAHSVETEFLLQKARDYQIKMGEARKTLMGSLVSTENYDSDVLTASLEEASDIIQKGYIKNIDLAEKLKTAFNNIKIDENGLLDSSVTEKQLDAFKKAFGDAADYITKTAEGAGAVLDQVFLGHRDQYENSAESLKDAYSEWFDQMKTQAAIEGLVQITSQVSALGMAISSAGNIGEIWTNDDLTTGEKLFQTLTAIAVVIGNVTQATRGLKQAFSLLNVSEATYAGLKTTETKALKKNTEELEENVKVAKVADEEGYNRLQTEFVQTQTQTTLATQAMHRFGQSLETAGFKLAAFNTLRQNLDNITNSDILTPEEKLDAVTQQKDVFTDYINHVNKDYDDFLKKIDEANNDILQKSKETIREVSQDSTDAIKEAQTIEQKELFHIKNGDISKSGRYAQPGFDINVLEEYNKQQEKATILEKSHIKTYKDMSLLQNKNLKISKNEIDAIKVKTSAVEGETKANSFLLKIKQKLAALSKADIALLALSAIVGVISAVSNSIKEARENFIEYNNELSQNYLETVEETNANLELYNSYLTLAEGYDAGTTAKEELIEATESLGDLIDDDIKRIALQTGNYDLLTQAILRAKDAALNKNISDSQKAYSAAESAVETAAVHGKGWASSNTEYTVTIGGGFWDLDDLKDEDKLKEIFGNIADPYYGGSGIMFTTKNNAAELAELYEGMQEYMQYMQDSGVSSSSEIYKNMQSWLAKMEESYNLYIKSRSSLANSEAEKYATQEFAKTTNYDEFINVYNKSIAKMQDLDPKLSTESATNALNQWIAQGGAGTEIIDYLNEKSLKESFNGDWETVRKRYNIGASDDRITRVKNAFNSGDLSNTEMQMILTNPEVIDTQMNWRAIDNLETTPVEELKRLAKELENSEKYVISFTEAEKEMIEEAGYTEETMDVYIKKLKKLHPELKDSIDEYKELAIQIAKSQSALETLSEQGDDWIDILENSDSDTVTFSKTIKDLRKNIQDLIGEDYDLSQMTDEFLLQNLETIKKLYNEDKNIREQAYVDLIKAFNAENINIDLGIEDNNIEQQVREKLIEINNEIQSVEDIELGVTLDQKYLDYFSTLVTNGNITAKEVNNALSKIGFVGKFTVSEVPVVTMEDGTVVLSDIITKFETIEYNSDSPALYLDKPKGNKNKNKSSSKSKKEYNKDEYDRYEKVNVELSHIETSLDRVRDLSDEAFGAEKIENYRKQIQLLNQQIEKTQEKLAIAEDEKQELMTDLSQYGITFDSNGVIQNYIDVFKKEQNKLNAAVDKYNRSAKSEADEKAYNDAQEYFDKFKELITDYDELITNFIPDLIDNIKEGKTAEVELTIDAFNAEIEVRLEMSEAERDWNEFKANIIEGLEDDDILGNAQLNLKQLGSFYKADGTGSIQELTSHINDLMAEISKDADGVFGTEKDSTRRDQLFEYYEKLVEELGSYKEIQEQIHDAYIEQMDEVQEKFDEQIESYEYISGMLDHNLKVLQLFKGEDAYSEMRGYYDAQAQNNLNQLDLLREQVVFWEKQMQLAEGNQEAWDSANEKWRAAVESLNGSIESSIETLQEQYLNAINIIFEELNNKITDNKGLEYINQEWDLINKEADMYLDSLNAIYAVQSLEDKYLEAIDTHEAVSSQSKLNDLMDEEIKALREKDKLTQYDIDRANKRYEIALKQIALEEAQQNKTTMRLRRDSQGNYSYQYTNDQSEINKLQQELSDLYNQLYNLDAQQYKDNLNEMYTIWDEFQQAMYEAAQINDPEERLQQEKLLQEYYGNLINGIVSQNEDIKHNLYQSTMSALIDGYQNNTENFALMTDQQQVLLQEHLQEVQESEYAAFHNLFDIYDVNVENFKTMVDEEKDLIMTEMIPAWDSGIQAMAEVLRGEETFDRIFEEILAQVTETTKEYTDQIIKMAQTASGDQGIKTIEEAYKALEKATQGVITQVQTYMDTNDNVLEKNTKAMESIQKVQEAVDKLATSYETAKNNAIAAADAAKTLWDTISNDAANAYDGAEEELNKAGLTSSATEGNVTGTDNLVPEEKPILEKGSSVEIKSGTRWYADSFGGGGYGSTSKQQNVTITYTNPGSPYPYHINKWGWIKKTDIVGYATGGYTGDWGGSEGRLAMLHKKELILNAADTKNILNTVEILRNITDSFGSSIFSKIAGITAGAAVTGSGDVLEQNVHIDATFPNVTNSNEVEQALSNLVNVASQYVNRK